MRVLVLSKYGSMGASSRYRVYQYLPYLSEQDFEFTVAPLFDNQYLRSMYSGKRLPVIANVLGAYMNRIQQLLRLREYDLIWMEKEALPWIPAAIENRMLKTGIPYVVDYDDAIFHRYDQHAIPFVRKMLGQKISQVMRNAAAVVAGNAYLAEHARDAGAQRVEIVPTVIDLSRYSVKTPELLEDTFTIGWIGSPSTAKYLNHIAKALKLVSQRVKTRIVLIGAGNMTYRHFKAEHIPWSESTEVQAIQTFDVGIMPLPDEPWEKGKCGFKLIQYMGCGLPVVGSPVGVNSEIVNHGENGFLAADISEWEKYLLELYDSRQLRAKMGQAGRQRVEQHYSLDVTNKRIFDILQQVMQQ